MGKRFGTLYHAYGAALRRLREAAGRARRTAGAAREPLRRWELALLLAVCITLFQGLLAAPVQVGWWGVIFPGLAPQPAQAETAEGIPAADGEVRVRLWLLDWLLDR